MPLWTKKFEPEDSEDKDSPLALQEREAAVAARHERWNLGAEFFMTEFQLTEVEYWYVMSLWWETERDWTPPRKDSRLPYGEKTDDLWNIDDATSSHLPPPPPLVVVDECGTDESRVLAEVPFGTTWPNAQPLWSYPPVRPGVWEPMTFGRPPDAWTTTDFDQEVQRRRELHKEIREVLDMGLDAAVAGPASESTLPDSASPSWGLQARQRIQSELLRAEEEGGVTVQRLMLSNAFLPDRGWTSLSYWKECVYNSPLRDSNVASNNAFLRCGKRFAVATFSAMELIGFHRKHYPNEELRLRPKPAGSRPWTLDTYQWKCLDRHRAAQTLSKVINGGKKNREVTYNGVTHQIEDLDGRVFLAVLWLFREDHWPDALAGRPFLKAKEYVRGLDTCPPSVFPQSGRSNAVLGDIYAGGWPKRGPEACGFRQRPRANASQNPLGDMNGTFPPMNWEERPAPDHLPIRSGRVGNPVRGKASRIQIRDEAMTHVENVYLGFSSRQRAMLQPVRFLIPTIAGAWQDTQQPIVHRRADGTISVGGHNAGHGARYRQSRDREGNWVWGEGYWDTARGGWTPNQWAGR